MKNCRTISQPSACLACSAALLLVAGLLGGCGNPTPHSGKTTADVTVTVTYGGEPVTEGRVDLSNPQTGEAAGGELNDEGIAAISGVTPGNYSVMVLPPMADPVPVEPGQPAAAAKEYPNIPKKVRVIGTSTLKADVTEDGANEFTFELKDAG